MNERLDPGPACREARATIQDRLDGPVEAARARNLETHLTGCAGCREFADGLAVVREGLQAIPLLRFPDDALEEVWDRTVRVERARFDPRSWGLDWRAAVAAAVVVAAVAGMWLGGDRSSEGTGPVVAMADAPSPDEIARVEQEIRLVLNLTAYALHRTEQATIQGVLAGEVVPALRRIPIRFPETTRAPGRRDGT